jgi:glycosyltransferase involved in cell wall biosynthesis
LHSTILPSGFWDSFKNLIYKILLNKCDKLIFVSKNQAEFWAKNYNINKQKSIYINNAIDESSFVDTFTEAAKSDIRNNLGFKQEDIIFGICGRLGPEKKHEDFIEAVYLARKRIPHLKGLIIGDGPQKDFLKKMINDYTLENVVKLTGYQADVRPYISICDCMTLVSISEGFSIAALEAMAMKKPMIMTNIGGASEIITNEATGFLYEVGDIKKLSELMIRMSNRSICQKMGEEAARQVKTNFTLCNMSKKYESFFLNIEPEK